MIGKIIGAMAGAKAAEHTRGIGGPGGALLGMGAVALARRLGPVGLIAATAGGYWLKRRNEAAERQAPKRSAKRSGKAKASKSSNGKRS